MINPEIGKLPKTTVDRIPLVIYIPPPPEGVKSALGGILHSYPPTTTNSPQPRFKRLRNFRKKETPPQDATDEKNNENVDMDGLWEANWELGEYPFVALEGSRAACAICLMDFEEPKRKEATGEGTSNQGRMENTSETIDEVVNIHISSGEEVQEKLKLVDAGSDSVQPLRLLPCSHVFHVCLFHSSFRVCRCVNNPGISRNHVWILGSLMYLEGVLYASELWKFPNLQRRSLIGRAEKDLTMFTVDHTWTFYTRRTRLLVLYRYS